MKLEAISIPLLMLASFAGSQKENIMDDLLMFDAMDSTLGILEKSFGESITQKLTKAFTDVTQNSRPPIEVLTNFIQDLSEEDVDSISRGIISIARGVADILELPGARRQLSFFIKMTPSVIRTLCAFVGGNQFGFGEGGVKTEPPSKNNAGEDDLMASTVNGIANMRTGKESNANNIGDVTGDLLLAGMSLMGSLGSTFLSGRGKSQQKATDMLSQIVTNVVENLLESGALSEEILLGLDELDIGELDEAILTNETGDQNKLNKKLEESEDLIQLGKVKKQPQSTEKPKFKEDL